MSPVLRNEVPGLVKAPTGTPPRDYGIGRRCAHPGCTTILSRYHAGRLCCLHEHGPQEAAMSKGPKPVKHPPAAKLRERMLAVLRADQGAFVVKPDDWTRYEWAHAVDSLRCHGYEIEGRSGRQGGGYRLVREPQSSPEVRTATEPAEPPQTPQAGSGETREGGSPGTRRSWDRDWLASPRPPEFGGVDVVCEPGGPARQGDVVVQTFVPVAGQGGPASEDPQMDALVKVVAALLPLDDDGRRWVLECAALRFVGPVLKLGLDT